MLEQPADLKIYEGVIKGLNLNETIKKEWSIYLLSTTKYLNF
jgi:hypothetical protein